MILGRELFNPTHSYKTITAPIYTRTRTRATNSADNKINKTAVVARVKTKNIAACIRRKF